MKKLIILLFIGFFFSSKAQQVPLGINYQAVIRNSNGAVLTNTNVSLKFEIYNTSTNTTSVYSETHTAIPTNTVGIATCTIGNSVNNTGNFSIINWQGGDVWYEVYLSVNGSAFAQIGAKQKFMTVPYAFYASKAGSVKLNAGNGITISSDTIINAAPNRTINITGAGTTSVIGTYPNYTVSSIASPSTTLVQGGNVSINQSGNTYTVSSPNYSLSTSANTLIITNGATTSSANLPNGIYSGSGALSGITTVTTGTNSLNFPSPDDTVRINAAEGSLVINRGDANGSLNTIAPSLRLTQSTGALNRIKFTNKTFPNYFWEVAAQNHNNHSFSAYSVNYYDGSSSKYYPVLLINGQRRVYINALNGPLSTFHVMENSSTTSTGGIISEGFARPGEITISRNNLGNSSGNRVPISAGDEIGRLSFSGAYSSIYSYEYPLQNSAIYVKAVDNFTTASQGSEMYFQTVASGTNVAVNVLKLTHDAKVGIGTINPVAKLEVLSPNSSTVSGFYVQQNGTFDAANFNLNNSAGTKSAVFAQSKSAGATLKSQNENANNGKAAEFWNDNINDEAVRIENHGQGPTSVFTATSSSTANTFIQTGTGENMKISNGPATASSTNIGLLLDGAHLKSVNNSSSLNSVSIFSVSSTSVFVNSTVSCDYCSDVKGIINITTQYPAAISGSASIDVQFSFTKKYSTVKPIVVLTPYGSNIDGFSYTVLDADAFGFKLRMYKPTNASNIIGISLPKTISFNYFVIE